MRFPNVRADVKTAFEMYHSLPYFRSGGIRKLFNGCSGSTASKIAKMTRDEMGTDLVEVTAHSGARLSHTDW